MVNDLMTPLSGAIGVLSLFGGIGLLMWIDYRSKIREKEYAHTERMKALESGQTLPDADIARSQADASRAWAAGLTALLVPLGMAGSAVGATALIIQLAAPSVHLPLVCVIWGVCGLVSLVAINVGFHAMRRRERSEERGQRSHRDQPTPPTAESLRAVDKPVNTME